MSLLLLAPDTDMQRWKKALLEVDPSLEIEIWPDVEHRQRVQFIVSWNQPEGVFEQYPNLRAVSSLGAGVDHILAEPNISGEIDICRVVSPSLVRQMQEYVLNAVLSFQHNMFTYFRQKEAGEWRDYGNKVSEEIPLGVMGLGKLGRPVSEILVQNGYQVNGWSRTRKKIPGVSTFGYEQLDQFLAKSRVLICLLPLTKETEGIMDISLFKQLKHPGFIINVGRGEHLVDEDLIYAIEKNWLEGACLDVFCQEPLPPKHPFWNREQIMITPHAASFTPPGAVASQIAENYKRCLSGMELMNRVDRQKGY